MARPVRLLSLLSRLGAPPVTPSPPVNGCRLASRDATGRARMGHVHGDRASNRAARHTEEMSDEELGLEDVEENLQALVDEDRKKQRTVKYHILRRQMTPSGAPQRKLTWDAIEQIRYLKREQPEEWTVERLAVGFSVTPDVILRVLRSKFVPAPERKAKQDAKIMAGLSQRVLPSGAGTRQDKLKLTGNPSMAALPSGSRDSAVVPVADQTLMLRGEGSDSLAKIPAAVLPAHLSGGTSEDATKSTEEDRITNTSLTEDNRDDEESWDGWVLTEEDLEELMEMEKPSPAVQVGKDFFDTEGFFLYRI